MRKKKGFTLIELLIVIAIIGILILLAAPKILGYTKDAKLAQIKNDIKLHENFIVAELAQDDNYIASWNQIEASVLDNLKSNILDKKGYIGNEYKFDDDYFTIPNKLIDTKLKGDFYYAKSGKVYYHEEGNNGKEIKKITFSSNELKNGDTQTFEIPDLKVIKNISIDNGEFELLENSNGKVTLMLKDGKISKTEQIGEFIPRDEKEIEFTLNWQEEGLRIIDRAKKECGSYWTDCSEEVDLSTVPAKFKEFKGYEGDFTRVYDGPQFKIVDYIFPKYENFKRYIYKGGKWIEFTPMVGTALTSGFRYSDDEGYSSIEAGYSLGDISKLKRGIHLTERKYYDGRKGDFSYNIEDYNLIVENKDYECESLYKKGIPKENDCTISFDYTNISASYTGMAFLGGPENAKWKYSGKVVRPESDTREKIDYYKYEITIEYN